MPGSRGFFYLKTVVFCVILSLFPLLAQAQYSGGTGTEENPFQIASTNDMMYMRQHSEDFNKNFILMSDLDLKDYTFTRAIIGPDIVDDTWGFQGTAFVGVFDGNNHIIRNMTINTQGEGYDLLGFFGQVMHNAKVLNLGFENVSINGGASTEFSGSVCGLSYGTISNCYAVGTINSWAYIGLLCGANQGTVNNCYVAGTINCLSRAQYVGGLCGSNYLGTMTNSYSTCLINQSSYIYSVGGLNGYNSGTVTGSFWNTQTSGLTTSAGGVGKTTAQMQDINTFLAAGWDFSAEDGDPADWMIYPGGYPALAWEAIAVVPDVTGLPQTEAQAAIAAAGLAAATVTQEYNDTVAAGSIIRQTPVAGSTVPTRTGVSLVVSLGKRYDGGAGTAANPYKIANADNLILLGNTTADYGKSFILTADIDLAGKGPNTDGSFPRAIIAPDTNDSSSGFQGTSFTGQVKGNGHIIRNLTINTQGAGTDFLGLFGRLSSASLVENLGMVNVTISGANSSYYLGGLCGYLYSGKVSGCYAAGIVSGANSADSLGGLCGYNNTGTISDCFSRATITGAASSGNLGGLCGYNYGGTILRCYATGPVSGGLSSANLGGLCGYNTQAGTITASCWDMQSSGVVVSAGGAGLDTIAMQLKSTYTPSGWTFVNDTPSGAMWHMPWNQAGYPMLVWQKDIPGDFAGDYGVDMAEFQLLSAGWLSGPYNIESLTLLATNWLKTSAIMEPKTFMAHWSFDEDGRDEQGNNTGLLTNGAQITHETGEYKIGSGALKLDGVNDYVNCGAGTGINNLSSFTVSLWFRANTIPTTASPHFICQRNSSIHLWSVSLLGSSNGHLTGYIGGSQTNSLMETSFTPVAGKWYHLAMTYDNVGDHKAHLYINGVEPGYVQQSAVSGYKLSHTAIPVTIGDRTDGGRACDGLIDDVRIYRRVLSATELANLIPNLDDD